GQPLLRARLPGTNLEDNRGQRDESGSACRPQSHRVLPSARAPLAGAGHVQRQGQGKGESCRMKTLLAFVFFLAAIPVGAEEQNPEALVKQVTAEVLDAIKGDKELAAGDRQKALRLAEEKVIPHIDFEEATRLAVGRAWSQASPEQKKQ